jgi:hypothetical protein
MFEPDSGIVEEAFEALGADPLYRRLCKVQESFRARLTPKPWRCGIRTPGVQWPWLDARDEARFVKWDEEYRRACVNFSTCRLVKTIGHAQVLPELQPLVVVHDELTRMNQPLKLA